MLAAAPLLALLSFPAEASNWLTKAAADGNLSWARAQNPDSEFTALLSTTDDEGYTPLIAAIRAKNVKNVEYLLLYDADASVMGGGGRAPIQGASSMRNLKIVELLLKRKEVKGSDVDGDGCTGVWALADRDGDADPAPIIRLLVQHGADPSLACTEKKVAPLHRAADRGDFPTSKALVLAGARLDSVDGEGRTPLLYAAQKGHQKVVNFLIDRGADPTLRHENVSPSMAAEAAGFDSIAAALRKAEGNFLPRGGGDSPAGRSVVSDVDNPKRKLPENPSDYALIVGVEKYGNGLPDAQFAERDAAAVRANLVALGVPERNIRHLAGSRASLAAMTALVEEWLGAGVGEEGRVFFYFSGHGSPDPATGQVFLVPYDGIPSLLTKTAYPVKKLYEGLDRLKAKQIVVALDACFSGMGGRSVLPEGARPLVTKTTVAPAPGSRLLILAAAGANQITGSLPEQGHGIFTYHLLKGLGGGAADSEGAITPMGLYEYLKPKVQDAAARQDREQSPVLQGAVTGELFPAPAR